MTARSERGSVFKWGAMLAVCLSILMSTVDFTVINVALPTLVKTMNTDFATIQWVILGYVVMVTSMTLTFSRLGDTRGKKRLFAGGLAAFTLASLLCGVSPGVWWLIGFRVFQGLGAAVMNSLAAAIATEVFPDAERGRAMGIIGSMVSVGLAAGPAVGGLLIGHFGWRSVFLVNLPIGVLAIWATLKFVPKTVHERHNLPFDIAGSAIMFVLMITYALAMTLGQQRGFGESTTLLLLAVSAVFLVGFALVERRSQAPMVDLRLFGNALFSVNLLMGWLVFIVIAASFIIPFYLELVKEYPPQVMGMMMMVIPLSMGAVSPGAGWLADRFGTRGISLIGLLVAIVGCITMAGLDRQTDTLEVILRMVPFGMGMGLFQSPNNSAVMGAVPRHRLGLASGLLTLSRTLGHTTGIPLAGAAFTAWTLRAVKVPGIRDVTLAPPEALVRGLQGVYHTAAGVIVAATLLAALALYLDQRRRRPSAGV